MKLVYKCSHCGVMREVNAPTSLYPVAPEAYLFALDGTTDWRGMVVPEFRKWIRHPCEPDIHGIAPLVAVIDRD